MRAWSTRTWRQQVRSSFDGERSGLLLESWFVYTCFGATRQMWALLFVVALNAISMYQINYFYYNYYSIFILNLSMY